MDKSLNKLLKGYQAFRKNYAITEGSLMHQLSVEGQKPKVMVIACADSRVDPAVIFGVDPGEIFVVRNVANVVPPYLSDDRHHGTSAALEFAVCYLGIEHLIILGHSQCGGISSLMNKDSLTQNDFITDWLSLVDFYDHDCSVDEFAKKATKISANNCLSFPWMVKRIDKGRLCIHRWFFDIEKGELSTFNELEGCFVPITASDLS